MYKVFQGSLKQVKAHCYNEFTHPYFLNIRWKLVNLQAMLLGKNMSSSQGKAKFQFNSSNLPLAAASSSKSIYQSGGVIQLPYPGAQISHANYYNYAPIQQVLILLCELNALSAHTSL